VSGTPKAATISATSFVIYPNNRLTSCRESTKYRRVSAGETAQISLVSLTIFLRHDNTTTNDWAMPGVAKLGARRPTNIVMQRQPAPRGHRLTLLRCKK
jgi:hypothetical protein